MGQALQRTLTLQRLSDLQMKQNISHIQEIKTLNYLLCVCHGNDINIHIYIFCTDFNYTLFLSIELSPALHVQ